jgi:hypothetical protein
MLEIVDSRGTVVATMPAKPSAKSGAGAKADGIKRISPLWEPAPPGPLPASAGMHRVVWPAIEPGSQEDSATAEERQPKVHTGVFTARLSIGAKRWTQDFEVLPPRQGS